jgi:lysyl-tRNA synthetase class 1
MTASGFVGITPKQWLEVSEPEVLRYLYIGTRPHAPITIDMDNIFVFSNDYEKAERIYFGREKADEHDVQNIKRAFELAQVKKENMPKTLPFQLSYILAARIAQVLPEKDMLNKAILLLKKDGHLKLEPTRLEKERIGKRLVLAKNWIEKYAPAEYKLAEEKKPAKTSVSQGDKKMLDELVRTIEKEKDGEALQQKIFEIAKANNARPAEFFKLIYQVLFSSNRGPRLGPYIVEIGREEIIKKLKAAV